MAEFFVNEGKKALCSAAAPQARRPPDARAVPMCVLAARKSGHRFGSDAEESEALIYNYSPVYSGPNGTFAQIYVF